MVLIVPACRKENPPLDRNKAPSTFITSAPTETTSTDYRVHLYWHGKDEDGIVEKYIWYISDTLLTLDPIGNPQQEQLDWNPEARAADYVRGRFTTRTDTVIIFRGYDEKRGVLVNRQAFHIASVDDGGKIDPSPARLQFLARVKDVPKVKFWTILGGIEKLYDPAVLDTIPMFTPFAIKFTASTVNNVITGYRWSYGGKIYPDFNADGSPDWQLPIGNPPEPVTVELANTGADALPSGEFNFKVIARDEAGALSRSDVITGEGLAKVMVNHDPDTRIIGGMCTYTDQVTGLLDSFDVDFSDGIPDTLPYHSWVRMHYRGWDHPADIPTLQYTNPMRPLKFQFRFARWSYDPTTHEQVAYKAIPWDPLDGPEDTNPCADISEEINEDSTTMVVATFDYLFNVRSFDEQMRSDGTPAEVRFVGNFPPKIDRIFTSFDDNGTTREAFDTLYVGWNGYPFVSRGDTLGPFQIDLETLGVDRVVWIVRRYKFWMSFDGHDDLRDPPRSGIKGWQYTVDGPDPAYTWKKEGEWIFVPDPSLTYNNLRYELTFRVSMPYDSVVTFGNPNARPKAYVLSHPPSFLGPQDIRAVGIDISNQEIFSEGIRGKSPFFEGCVRKYEDDGWLKSDFNFAAYARSDTLQKRVVFKLVY